MKPKETIMTFGITGRVLAFMLKRTKATNRSYLTPYMKKCLDAHRVVCTKCDFNIEFGQKYIRSTTGPRQTKYFHPSCLESTYQ